MKRSQMIPLLFGGSSIPAPARLRANAAAGALVGYAKFTLVSIFERRRRYSSIISHLS